MYSKSIAAFLLLILVSFASAVAPRCGRISGAVNPVTQELTATWEGFDESATFEWAVVSHRLASQAFVSDKICRPTPGFHGQPDIKEWTPASESVISLGKLLPDETYYVVLRAHLDDNTVLFSNSPALRLTNSLRARDLGYVARDSVSSSLSSSSSGDDDDDDLEGWEIALIVLGAVCCCLIILGIIALVFFKGFKREDKYQTNVHRNENVEKI